MNQKRRGGPIASIPVIGAWALLALAPTSTRCVGGEMEDKFQAARESGLQDLATQLISAEVANELNALPALASEDRVERLAEFHHHAHNASRLNHTSQTVTPPLNLAHLTPQTAQIIKQALDEFTRSNSSDIRFNIFNRISRDQAWALLESLEYDARFDSAATLGRLLLAGEAAGESRDLLNLVTGRCEWIANSDDENQDFGILNAALQSQNQTIAHNAQIFEGAANTPADYESLILAHHLWETLHLDRSLRDKGSAVAHQIIESASAVAQSVANDPNLSGSEKEYRAGRIASVVSEAAFQWSHPEALDWCVGVATPLTQADPEDKLTPAFFHAWWRYSRSRYQEAAAEFEPIFLSGVQCDIAANAGVLLADCYRHLENDVAFAATANLVFETYPNQTYILNQYQGMKAEAVKLEEASASAVHQYLEAHYQERMKKALAEQQGAAKPKQTAKTKEEKKVAVKD